MTPFLADMPPLFSSRPLPECIARARAEWQAAVRTARKDLPGAARAFLQVAARLEPAAIGLFAEAVTSMRLLALENALEAGTAAGDRAGLERELSRLAHAEPALRDGIARILRGESESKPPRDLSAMMGAWNAET